MPIRRRRISRGRSFAGSPLLVRDTTFRCALHILNVFIEYIPRLPRKGKELCRKSHQTANDSDGKAAYSEPDCESHSRPPARDFRRAIQTVKEHGAAAGPNTAFTHSSENKPQTTVSDHQDPPLWRAFSYAVEW